MAIRLFWQGGNRNEVNFGDTLSPLLVELLSGKKVVYADPSNCDIAAIGSILDKIVKKQWKRVLKLRFHPVQIWGSGSFGPHIIKNYKFLKMHAVRGPLTRDAMKLASDLPLGDPGVLVDRFDIKQEKKYRWGIIPHVVDRSLPIIKDMHNSTPNALIIDLADPDILKVLRDIAACDFIVSSSLHGLITADALGIPHIWTRVSGNVFGGDWKFDDYFSSVGRQVNGPTQVMRDLRSFEAYADLADRKIMEKRKQDIESAFRNINL